MGRVGHENCSEVVFYKFIHVRNCPNMRSGALIQDSELNLGSKYILITLDLVTLLNTHELRKNMNSI